MKPFAIEGRGRIVQVSLTELRLGARRCLILSRHRCATRAACLPECSFLEEMDDLLGDVTAVHDERVRGRQHEEVRGTVQPRARDADLAVVWAAE